MQRFFWLFVMPGVRKSEFSFVKLAMTMHAFETSSRYFFDSNDAKFLIEDKSWNRWSRGSAISIIGSRKPWWLWRLRRRRLRTIALITMIFAQRSSICKGLLTHCDGFCKVALTGARQCNVVDETKKTQIIIMARFEFCWGRKAILFFPAWRLPISLLCITLHFIFISTTVDNVYVYLRCSRASCSTARARLSFPLAAGLPFHWHGQAKRKRNGPWFRSLWRPAHYDLKPNPEAARSCRLSWNHQVAASLFTRKSAFGIVFRTINFYLSVTGWRWHLLILLWYYELYRCRCRRKLK